MDTDGAFSSTRSLSAFACAIVVGVSNSASFSSFDTTEGDGSLGAGDGVAACSCGCFGEVTVFSEGFTGCFVGMGAFVASS